MIRPDREVPSIQKLAKSFDFTVRVEVQIFEDMNVEGAWNILKGRLKQKWAQVRNDEVLRTKGEIDEILGCIQMRTGQTRRAVMKSLKRFG